MNRFTGPGRFRFILQPTFAILLGVRGGLADAKAGDPPYLFGLIFAAGRRREILRTEMAAIRTLLAMGIVLDVVFQVFIYRSVHPGATLLIGPILICLPYSVARALTNRLTRRVEVNGLDENAEAEYRSSAAGTGGASVTETPVPGARPKVDVHYNRLTFVLGFVFGG